MKRGRRAVACWRGRGGRKSKGAEDAGPPPFDFAQGRLCYVLSLDGAWSGPAMGGGVVVREAGGSLSKDVWWGMGSGREEAAARGTDRSLTWIAGGRAW